MESKLNMDMRSGQPLVFAIGCGKTGTTSLAQAFRDCFDIRAQHFRGIKELCQGLDSLEEDDGRFDAGGLFVDWPLWFYWEHLVRLYPNARFILTTRDVHWWKVSRIIHELRLLVERSNNRHIFGEINIGDEVREFIAHNRRVCDYFADEPDVSEGGRFLQLSLCDGNGGQPTLDAIEQLIGVHQNGNRYPWCRANSSLENLSATRAVLTDHYRDAALRLLEASGDYRPVPDDDYREGSRNAVRDENEGSAVDK